MLLPIPHVFPLALGLAYATVSDVKRRTVPNFVTLPLFAVGLAMRGFDLGVVASLSGLGAAALVVAVLLVPFQAGGLGGGDVKLAAATAAWLGLGKLLWFALATAVAGGVVALVVYACSNSARRAEVKTNLTLAALHGDMPVVSPTGNGRLSIPYAVSIATGAAAALFLS